MLLSFSHSGKCAVVSHYGSQWHLPQWLMMLDVPPWAYLPSFRPVG